MRFIVQFSFHISTRRADRRIARAWRLKYGCPIEQAADESQENEARDRCKPGKRLAHSPGFAVSTEFVKPLAYCVLGTHRQVSGSNL
jgi:hypothetical protein